MNATSTLRPSASSPMTLHVCAHQCAVCVVVFEEWNQRGRDRYELLGTDIDVIDFIAGNQDEVAGLTGIDELIDQAALVVEFYVGLRDNVTVLFPGGQIEREWLVVCRLFPLSLQLLVHFLHVVQLQ